MGDIGDFLDAIGKPEDALELDRAALLIARDAYPGLDVGGYLAKLDEIAAAVRSSVDAVRDIDAKLGALRLALSDRFGFRGNRGDYYDPRNSYLNDVLDRRLGIPISLSVVYIEVGRRVGLTLRGIGLPGHFLVGLFDGPTNVYLDPFEGGRVVDEAACRALVAEVYGGAVEFRREMLAPVAKREILFRMLNNLKLIYMSRSEPEAALLVVDKMLAIAPGSWVDHRDRGLIRYGLGQHDGARADLVRYLRAMPQAPDRAAIEDVLAAIETIRSMYR